MQISKSASNPNQQYTPDPNRPPAPRIVEAGEYVVEVIKVEESTSVKHPEWGPSCRWVVRVIEEPLVGAFASGFTKGSWNPGNNLDEWCKAIGVNLGDGGSTDTTTYKHRQCRANIVMNGTFANIDSLEPMTERAKARISPNLNTRPVAPAAAAVPAPTPVAPAVAAPSPAAPPAAKVPIDIAPRITAGIILEDDSLPF